MKNPDRNATRHVARADLCKWICIGCLLTATLSAADSPLSSCEALTQASRAKLTAYVAKLVKAPAETSFQILSADPENDACFRRLEFLSSDQKKLTLFLSPDQRFMAPQLFDSNVDPAVAEAKSIETTKAQINDYIERTRPPIRGPATAPVTIAMFSDLQCPYCRSAMSMLGTEVLPKVNGQVRLAYIHYPLEAHAWAAEAALRLACVARQSSTEFWRIQDYVFEHQAEMTAEKIGDVVLSQAKLAADPALHVGKLQKCIEAKETAPAVEADAGFGSTLAITATPTLFINGKRLVGLAGADQVLEVIRMFTTADASRVTPEGKGGQTGLKP